jgi:DNA-binding response OmpR family regulator
MIELTQVIYMAKILIVEDDEKLRKELKTFLVNNGYEVNTLDEFNDSINKIMDIPSDLILLDINLPYLNGEVIVKSLKEKIKTPVIIITSQNSDIDELLCLNYGADDFVTKPFNLQVLLARINRLLKVDISDILKYNDLEVNLLNSTMKYDNKVMELSKNEIKILGYLIKNKGHIVNRDDLMDYMWDTNEFVDDNTLTVNVNRLRTKLEEIGVIGAIETRRGQGYILV